jgi:NAD(P)-dependent dehydrogenase (short-subunit alcohol dehydrogenase family)
MAASWTKRFDLTGKIAMVTGATKGIGLEACKVLSDAGADIVAVGRDVDGLESIKSIVESNASGRKCAIVNADLSTVEGCDRASSFALDAYGGVVDILVNNAGVALCEDLLVASVEDWDMTMALNLRAPFLLARKIVPGMIARGRGKIVNVSSQAGKIGLAGHGAYCSSKSGLNGLTRVMTSEWAGHNLQINSVSPTVVLTDLGIKVWGDPRRGDPMRSKIPAGRFCDPIEVADAILFLSSSASDMINGHDLMVDGGYTAL